MSWTFCTSGSAIAKAGVDANISGSLLASWSDEAEGRIESETRRKWVDNYSDLPSGVQNLLSDVCSSKIAKQIICFDLGAYTNRAIAQTMLNVQDDIERDGVRILRDFKSNELKDP